MLGALISAFVLCCVIKKVAGEEVEMGNAFGLELLAPLVGSAATGFATAPISSTTSMGAGLRVGLAILSFFPSLLCNSFARRTLRPF